MAYNKTQWQDLPNQKTPIDAEHLNKIENELEALDTGKQDAITTSTALNVASVKASGAVATGGKTGPTDGVSGTFINASGGIEISHQDTPYIDFHYANSTSDYTSRLLEMSSGVLKASGALLNANNLMHVESGFLTSESSTTNVFRSVISATVTTHGGRILVIGILGGVKVTTNNMYMGLVIDSSGSNQIMTTSARTFEPAIGIKILDSVPAGQHTFYLGFRGTGDRSKHCNS